MHKPILVDLVRKILEGFRSLAGFSLSPFLPVFSLSPDILMTSQTCPVLSGQVRASLSHSSSCSMCLCVCLFDGTGRISLEQCCDVVSTACTVVLIGVVEDPGTRP